MIVDISTVLDCSAAKAWEAVQKSSLLLYVIWPLARVVPKGAPFPDRWSEGLTVQCKSFVFGVIPIGVRTLSFEKIDQKNHEIQTREHDPLISRWDHLISIKPLTGSRSIGSTVIAKDGGVPVQRPCDRATDKLRASNICSGSQQ
jgi:hypothetical protein